MAFSRLLSGPYFRQWAEYFQVPIQKIAGKRNAKERPDKDVTRKNDLKEESILQGLSAEQQTVVKSPALCKQVIAAAGSGKTRTVIQLTEYELRSGRTPPGRLLLLTFSRKASAEMRQRLPVDLQKDVHVSTFHAFCLHLIRAYHPRGKAFQVVGEERRLEILKPLFRRYRFEIGGIPYDMLLAHPNLFRQRFPKEAFRILRFWNLYKDKHDLLEYQDLITMVLASLRGIRLRGQTGSWLESFLSDFDMVIVDEFQDTDPAQLEFLKLLAPPRLVVVVCASHSTKETSEPSPRHCRVFSELNSSR
ncbi:MAG: UvrD-helicase domain-containing protein [Leptospiraceae bacterium]|nr:UvrD-helicase domain-containing protein [Leptospiraceae bacterium]